MADMKLTDDEIRLVEAHRKRTSYVTAYNTGINDAARLAYSYGEQCCGGSGEGGEGYKNLANAIFKLEQTP